MGFQKHGDKRSAPDQVSTQRTASKEQQERDAALEAALNEEDE